MLRRDASQAFPQAFFCDGANLIQDGDDSSPRALNGDEQGRSCLPGSGKRNDNDSSPARVDNVGGQHETGTSFLDLRADGGIEVHPPDVSAPGGEARSRSKAPRPPPGGSRIHFQWPEPLDRDWRFRRLAQAAARARTTSRQEPRRDTWSARGPEPFARTGPPGPLAE